MLSESSYELNNKEVKNKEVLLPSILKGLMKKRGLNLRALSTELDIPISTLSTYATSKKASYNPMHLSALADFFNCSIDNLLFGAKSNLQNPIKQHEDEIMAGVFEVVLRKINRKV